MSSKSQVRARDQDWKRIVDEAKPNPRKDHSGTSAKLEQLEGKSVNIQASFFILTSIRTEDKEIWWNQNLSNLAEERGARRKDSPRVRSPGKTNPGIPKPQKGSQNKLLLTKTAGILKGRRRNG